MSNSVIYVGFANARHLAAEDFAKLGVEVEEGLRFVKGELVEVSDDVAKLLTTHSHFAGEFVIPEQGPATTKADQQTATGSPEAVGTSPDGEVLELSDTGSTQSAIASGSSTSNASDSPARSDTAGRSETGPRSGVTPA